jgi:hypothetical protein
MGGAMNGLSRWFDWRPRCKLLACIYTCDAHNHLLERFYRSEVGSFLRENAATRILEVHADPGIGRPRIAGSRMVLRSNESYKDLPAKTQRMIEFSVKRIRFDSLLKIDITTVMTQSELGLPEYSDIKAMDMAALAEFLRHADYGRDYNGFLLYEGAGREGAESWARKKGLSIDYARFFGDGPMLPFYAGKCYVLSRRFAEFIARSGAETAIEHQRYFPGSEDVMIGRLYDRFRSVGAS